MLLDETLKSVVDQRYRPIECIVVDDGSTDNTADVLRRYASCQDQDFRLVIVEQENQGAQRARNKGTILSTGEFIQYLDSDDLLFPEKLSKQVTFLNENQHYDCVFGDWEKGTFDERVCVKSYKADDFIKQILTIERPIVNFSFLMRRSLIRNSGNWDESLKRMQELDFQLSALMAGGHFQYQQQVCGLWRHHYDARIHNQTSVIDMVPFFQKWEAILKRHKQFSTDMGECIAKWYMWFLSQSKQQKTSVLIPVLEEAVRLKPSLAFYRTPKMKLLRFLMGRRWALYLWLLRYQRT
jgi:glycosyltransferase involved in cell wall biosynthesis